MRWERPPAGRCTIGAVIAALTVVTACGPSAMERRQKAIDKVELPAAAQPADPCRILSTAEITAATGLTVREPKGAPPARGTDEIRACFWFHEPDGGFVSVVTSSQAAEREVAERMAEVAGLAPGKIVQANLDGLADITRRFTDTEPRTASPVGGLGDRAYSTADPSLNVYRVQVLVGTSDVELSSVGLPLATPEGALLGLAKLAAHRLAPG